MKQGATGTVEIPSNRPPGRRVALKRLFAHISDVSTLAAGAQTIFGLAKSSNIDLDDLQELVQTDPSVVAQVLRRVNSPYYRLDKSVQDLTTAGKLLGFGEVRNLALTVYLSRMFKAPVEVGSYSNAGLWSHCVAVAAASHLVSRVCGRSTPTEAFIAGLLHDIGLLMISQQMRQNFMDLMDQVHNGRRTPEIEQHIYQFDHAQLGAHIASKWDVPGPIIDAIRYHHDVENYSGAHRELVYVVSIANYLCSRAGCTSLGIHNVSIPPDLTYKVLDLDEVALGIIWRELSTTLDGAAHLAAI